MDLFSNMANWNAQDLSNGGILGASMNAKLRAEEAERASRPKPGKYCAKICTVNDERCAPCLELQRRFEHALGQLEKLEETAELSSEEVLQLLLRKKIVKCSLCGAPYEKGRSDCAYCGTDIAVSKADRNIQIMQKVDEVWALFAQKGELVGGYLKSNNKWADKILKLGEKFGYTAQTLNAATSNEIKQSADQYGISLSQYLHGVAMGDLNTPKMFRLEELNKALEQRNKEFKEQQALNAQRAEQERQARQAVAEQKRQSQREYWERYGRARSTPQYVGGGGGGGSSDCCGKCCFYYNGNKCAIKAYEVNASYFCGSFKRK